MKKDYGKSRKENEFVVAEVVAVTLTTLEGDSVAENPSISFDSAREICQLSHHQPLFVYTNKNPIYMTSHHGFITSPATEAPTSA